MYQDRNPLIGVLMCIATLWVAYRYFIAQWLDFPSDLPHQAQQLCTQTPGCTQAQVLMSATGLQVQRIVRLNVRTPLNPKAEQQARERLAAALPQARHVRLAVHHTPGGAR